MKRSKVFGLILALGAVAVTAVMFAVPAMAGNGVKKVNSYRQGVTTSGARRCSAAFS